MSRKEKCSEIGFSYGKDYSLSWRMLDETNGLDLDVECIHSDSYRGNGCNINEYIYKIGPQLCFVELSYTIGYTDLAVWWSTYDKYIAEKREKAQERRDKRQYRLPLPKNWSFKSYSFKNPKEWDSLLDPILRESSDKILFFKNKSQVFCATRKWTSRRYYGGNEWLAVSTFQPRNFTCKKVGPPMQFSRYCGKDEYIESIYRKNVERITEEEFRSIMGIDLDLDLKYYDELFPNWK